MSYFCKIKILNFMKKKLEKLKLREVNTSYAKLSNTSLIMLLGGTYGGGTGGSSCGRTGSSCGCDGVCRCNCAPPPI
jgi:hypothetical protein